MLAHQGGWDEVLLVLLPIALFAFLLWVANKRAERPPKTTRPSPAEDEEKVDLDDGECA